MFLWIRHYLAQVCALLSALLVFNIMHCMDTSNTPLTFMEAVNCQQRASIEMPKYKRKWQLHGS